MQIIDQVFLVKFHLSFVLNVPFLAVLLKDRIRVYHKCLSFI